MMKIKKRLLNPFVLMAQGFVAGAVIFFATAPAETDVANRPPPIQAAALPDRIDA